MSVVMTFWPEAKVLGAKKNKNKHSKWKELKTDS